MPPVDTSKSATRISNAQKRLREKAASLATAKLPALRRESSLQDRPVPNIAARNGAFNNFNIPPVIDEQPSQDSRTNESDQRAELFQNKNRSVKGKKAQILEQDSAEADRTAFFQKNSCAIKVTKTENVGTLEDIAQSLSLNQDLKTSTRFDTGTSSSGLASVFKVQEIQADTETDRRSSLVPMTMKRSMKPTAKTEEDTTFEESDKTISLRSHDDEYPQKVQAELEDIDNIGKANEVNALGSEVRDKKVLHPDVESSNPERISTETKAQTEDLSVHFSELQVGEEQDSAGHLSSSHSGSIFSPNYSLLPYLLIIE